MTIQEILVDIFDSEEAQLQASAPAIPFEALRRNLFSQNRVLRWQHSVAMRLNELKEAASWAFEAVPTAHASSEGYQAPLTIKCIDLDNSCKAHEVEIITLPVLSADGRLAISLRICPSTEAPYGTPWEVGLLSRGEFDHIGDLNSASAGLEFEARFSLPSPLAKLWRNQIESLHDGGDMKTVLELKTLPFVIAIGRK